MPIGLTIKYNYLSVYTYLINNSILEILIYNDSNYSIILSKRFKLRKIVKYKAKEYYAIDFNL